MKSHTQSDLTVIGAATVLDLRGALDSFKLWMVQIFEAGGDYVGAVMDLRSRESAEESAARDSSHGRVAFVYYYLKGSPNWARQEASYVNGRKITNMVKGAQDES